MNKFDLKVLLSDLGIIGKKSTSKSEFDLLDSGGGFSTNAGYYYKFTDNDLTSDEINVALAAMSAKNIRTIKNVCIFFLVLTVISVLITLFGYFKLAEFVSSFSSILNY